MYWLPPSRVKQSGKATTTGGMCCSPISRSSRSGRFSRKPTQFVWDKPLLVKPTRSTSSGLSHTNWVGFRENLPERLDRLIGEQHMPPVVVAFPDCFTRLGG